jgi:hypothetical protein
LVATIGDVVVVPAVLTTGRSSTALSLRFLNSRTGAIVADRELPGGLFDGLRAQTVGGKPVVEVRYTEDRGQVNALFDATGQQVWTSEGKSVGVSPSVGDMASGGLFASGYRLLYTPDPGTGSGTWNRGGVYDVLDVADHTVMSIPVNVSVDPATPAAGIRNSVSLVGGYAVVATPARTAEPETTVTTNITVYDLAAGAKLIATVAESTIKPANGDAPAIPAAAAGDKLLLTWMGPTKPPAQPEFHEGPYQDFFLTVLDTSSGRSTAPVDTGVAPTGVAIPPTAFVDESTGTVVESGLLPNPGGTGLSPSVMFAVDLAHGTVSWKRQGSNDLQPLSTHDNVLYGLQHSSTGQPRLIEVRVTDGQTITDRFTVAPLAFTADGTPVFVEATVPPPSATPTPSATARRPASQPDNHVIEVWAPTPR